MTPNDLEKAGRLLYGSRWRTELARALCYNSKVVVDAWMADPSSVSHRKIPHKKSAAIVQLVAQRKASITEWLKIQQKR